MQPYTIPYHLTIPCLISLCILIFIVLNRKGLFGKKKRLWRTLIVFLAIYAIILMYIMYLDYYYYLQLHSFDLDKNGSFSQDEITPEQQKAQLKHIADNVRNLSFITGLILSFILASIFYIGEILFDFLRKNNIINRKL